MKSIIKRIGIFTGVVTIAAFLTISAISQNSNETVVKALDSISLDGGTLSYSYSIMSRCNSNSHDNSIIIATTSKQKLINSFGIKIIDDAYESQCNGARSKITVFGTKNLITEINVKSKEMINRGYKIDPNATITLPPVRRVALQNPSVSYGYETNSNSTTLPAIVDVAVVEYTPIWRCLLKRNDNYRTDSFEGTGATLDEARRNASANCKSTNSQFCDQYSNSPEYTTCDAQYQEKTKYVQYNSNNLPLGATMDTWKCVLKKNDRLSGNTDGFEGYGKTQDAARAEAANKCSATNNPRCNNYSTDDNHTICSPQMVVYGTKPTAVWKCTLRKNDGSRNDGFTGTGSTEAEARGNTISGCQSTNNPYCMQYSNDPAHTQCSVDFAYAQ